MSIQSVTSNKHLTNLALLLSGSFFYALGTQCFLTSAMVAPGGASGIALMVNYLTGAPIGTLIFLINIPLLALSWFFLSHAFTIRTVLACALTSAITDVLIAPFLPIYYGDRLLSCLFGGVLVGIGMAFIFLSGCTTGGSDIIGYLIQKKMPHLPIGQILLIVDGILLVVSIYVFGNIESGLFGLITLFTEIQIIDGIIYGIDRGNMATIVTSRPEQISAGIIRELDRTATVVPGYGAYSKADTHVLLCAVRKSQFSRLKQIVKEIDPYAFVMVAETSAVYGEGFKNMAE